MLLLKTRQQHMDAVRRSHKHASDVCPKKIGRGDWLLIQVTSGAAGNETHRVKYAMQFLRCYPDTAGESFRLFGYSWQYIIEGDAFRILRHPFDIETIKVSSTNYGQGVIRFAYVHPADASAIIKKELLTPA
jgi:hypothetical protein